MASLERYGCDVAGTERAVDPGYGDDAYFDALETKVNAVLKAFDELPPRAQATTVDRLRRVRNRAEGIGWGYRDHLNDAVSQIERRAVQTNGQAGAGRLRGKVSCNDDR